MVFLSFIGKAQSSFPSKVKLSVSGIMTLWLIAPPNLVLGAVGAGGVEVADPRAPCN